MREAGIKALRFVPFALCAGFLAGHGFEVTVVLLPLLVAAGVVYLAAALLDIEFEEHSRSPK